MASGDMALKIIISALDNASSVFGTVGKAAQALGSGNALGAVAIAGVAVAAGLADSVKSAGDFQSGLTSLATGAGESVKNLDAVGKGMLQISTDTGQSTKDLTSSMYLIESSGYRSSDALKLMTTAAQGSKVGNADLTQVTQVLTTAMHDFSIPVEKSVPVMNSLVATTSAGQSTMDQLTGALTKVMPTASKAGVSFTDVEGALATMSLAGDKGAAAGTHLNQMLLSLEKPSSAASKELKAVGLTTDEVAAAMKQSLPEALQLITDAVGKKFPAGSAEYIAALGTIVGGTKQMQAALELTGSSMKDLVNNTNAISSAYQNSGKDVTNYGLVQATLNFQMARLGAAFEALKITIGQALLPVITAVATAVADFVAGLAGLTKSTDTATKSIQGIGDSAKPVVNVFGQLGQVWNDIMKAVKPLVDFLKNEFSSSLKEIGDLVKSTLIPAWNDFLKSIGPALPALKLLGEIIIGTIVVGLIVWLKLMEGVIAILVLVLTGVTRLAQGLMILISWAVDAGKAIVGAFEAAPQFFSDLWKKIKEGAQGLWKDLVNFAKGAWKNIQDVWGGIGQWFQDRWKDVQNIVSDVWKNIQGVAKQAWANIVGTIQVDIKNIVGLFKWLYDHDYYFKDLVDFAKKTFNDGIKAIQTNWDSFTKWWSQFWSDRQKETQKATDSMKATTDKWGQDTSKQVSSDWDGISKNLSKFWDGITQNYQNFNKAAQKDFQDAWAKISQTLQDWGTAALKYMKDALQSIGDAIGNFWSNTVEPALGQIGQKWNDFWNGVAQNAKDIGKNIMQGIADGIKAGGSILGDAIHNAISMALGALGLHNIPGFTGGVQNFSGGWAVVGERGPELLFLPSGASVIPSGQPIPSANSHTSSSPSSDQPMIIYTVLDGKVISKVVTTYQNRELRVQGGIRSL